MAKFKLKRQIKTENLLGSFTIGRIYNICIYNKNLHIVKDDLGVKRLININKENFTTHFVDVNKERKQKLITIEHKCI